MRRAPVNCQKIHSQPKSSFGAARAGYASVLFPPVALALSTWLEGFVWHVPAIAGMALSLAGNVIILRRRAAQPA